MLRGHQQEPEGWGVRKARVKATQGPMVGGKQSRDLPSGEDTKTQPPAFNSQGLPISSCMGGLLPPLPTIPKNPHACLMPY